MQLDQHPDSLLTMLVCRWVDHTGWVRKDETMNVLLWILKVFAGAVVLLPLAPAILLLYLFKWAHDCLAEDSAPSDALCLACAQAAKRRARYAGRL